MDKGSETIPPHQFIWHLTHSPLLPVEEFLLDLELQESTRDCITTTKSKDRCHFGQRCKFTVELMNVKDLGLAACWTYQSGSYLMLPS